MAKQEHTLLKIAGAAVAAFGGYEWIYKPWKANQDLIAAGAGGGSTLAPYGGSTLAPYGGGGGSGGGSAGVYTGGTYVPSTVNPLAYVASPTTLPSTNSPQPSNLDPGASVGGIVGACMHKKNLDQATCTNRVNAIITAYRNSLAQLASLQGGATATALQAALAANQAAAASDLQNISAASARGDTGAVTAYKAAYAGHSANVLSIQAQINAIPGQITALQSAIAALIQNFANNTGLDLRSVVQ